MPILYSSKFLREEKNEYISIPGRKYIGIHQNFLDLEYGALQGSLAMNEFERFFVLVILD